MGAFDVDSVINCTVTRDGVYLYCTEVTKLLLLSESVFIHLADFIRVLEVGPTTTIPIPEPEPDSKEYKSVLVTCLPAGHCPGSVMFLFEGNEGNALYTGDFRWERNFATTLPALCVDGHIKPIDSMYVDTTFCVPEAFFIPSRDDCLAATAQLVLSWLQRSQRHFVHISSRSKYGHEPLLAHLAREAQTQVHVSAERALMYDQIMELKGVYTPNPSARIHACSPWMRGSGGEHCLPCGYTPPCQDDQGHAKVKVMVIRPSTMWFTAQPSRLNELVVSPTTGRGLYRVCYSFHSSYSELRDLVSLLRPSHIYPNVLPADNTWEQVTSRLRSFLMYQHKRHLHPAGENTTAKPLGLLKRKRNASQLTQSDSEGLVFDSPDNQPGPHKGSQLSSQESAGDGVISPTKSVASEAHSSYQGSDPSDVEVDLFASDEGETTPVKNGTDHPGHAEREGIPYQQSGSLLSYISGGEDMEEEDHTSCVKSGHMSSVYNGKDFCFDMGTVTQLVENEKLCTDTADVTHLAENEKLCTDTEDVTHLVEKKRLCTGSIDSSKRLFRSPDKQFSSTNKRCTSSDKWCESGNKQTQLDVMDVMNMMEMYPPTILLDSCLKTESCLNRQSCLDAESCPKAKSCPKTESCPKIESCPKMESMLQDPQELVVIHSSQSSTEENQLHCVDMQNQNSSLCDKCKPGYAGRLASSASNTTSVHNVRCQSAPPDVIVIDDVSCTPPDQLPSLCHNYTEPWLCVDGWPTDHGQSTDLDQSTDNSRSKDHGQSTDHGRSAGPYQSTGSDQSTGHGQSTDLGQVNVEEANQHSRQQGQECSASNHAGTAEPLTEFVDSDSDATLPPGSPPGVGDCDSGLNSLVHVATDTVNKKGGCIHQEVNVTTGNRIGSLQPTAAIGDLSPCSQVKQKRTTLTAGNYKHHACDIIDLTEDDNG